MPQPKKAVRPAYLTATAEGGPVPVAAGFGVAVVQVTVIDLARHQDDQGRMEQAELHRLAAVDVQRRVAKTPGNDAEIRGMQDGFQAPVGVSGSLARAVSCRPGGRSERPGRAGRPAPAESLRDAATWACLCREGPGGLACFVRFGRMASLLPPASGYQRHRPCCSPQATDGPRHLPTLHQGGAEGKIPTHPL